MKNDDVNIDVEGDMLIFCCNREEKKEEKDARFTRKAYNYASFSRGFPLSEEVKKKKIDAEHEEGVLKLVLPKKDGAKKLQPVNILQ